MANLNEILDAEDRRYGRDRIDNKDVQNLHAVCVALTEVKAHQWLRPDLGSGPVGFLGFSDRVEELQRFAGRVIESPLQYLSSTVAVTATGAIEGVLQRLTEIRRLSVQEVANEGRQWGAIRQQLADRLNEALHVADQQLIHLTVFLDSWDAAQATARALPAADDIIEEVETLAETAREQVGAIQALANAAKAAAAEQGMREEAIHFDDEAREHHAAATRWLLAAGALGLFTVGAAIWNAWWTWHHPLKSDASQAAQVIAAKVLIFSILVSATVWCAKHYSAHRHNVVVNRHRRNALLSFDRFVKSTRDDGTKDAVLRQATASIFAPQATGYSSSGSESNTPTVVELMQSFGGKE